MAKPGKTGTVVFVLIVLGYLGFELYVVGRNSYRTEPDYIFRSYVQASQAVESCGVLKAGSYESFPGNLLYVQGRAADALAEANANLGHAAAATAIRELEIATRREVEDLISRTGCDEKEVWMLRRRYENYSRRNHSRRQS